MKTASPSLCSKVQGSIPKILKIDMFIYEHVFSDSRAKIKSKVMTNQILPLVFSCAPKLSRRFDRGSGEKPDPQDNSKCA